MSEPPPYRKIVTQIKERVANRELGAGDRIPSTRAIAAEWGVAIATATKAVAALRAEGVVHTRPRSGAVVTARAVADTVPRRAPVPADLPLRRRIIAAAIAIADTEGIAAVSMRSVAAQVELATMTLYRHVAGKDDLVFQMIDTTFAELAGRRDRDGDWRIRLAAVARELWRLFGRHPWLAQVVSLSRAQPVPALIGYADRVLDVLSDTGMSAHDRMSTHITLYGFVQGLSSALEQEAGAVAETGLSDSEWMDRTQPQLGKLVASGRFPAFAAAIAELDDGYDHDLDALFELGLSHMLDGLATRVGRG